MKTNSFRLAILALALGFQVAAAKTPDAPKHVVLHAETEFTIEKYLPDVDVFILVLRAEPAVGPNYVTAEELKNALDIKGTKEEFMKKMSRDEDAIFVVKKDLTLLWPKELEQRKKTHKH